MSQSALQRFAQTRELTSAILLTARNVFTPTPVSVHTGISPLTRIAGVTIFQRGLLTLQRAGVNQIFVLAGDEAETLKAVVRDGPPITAGIRWIPVREFPLDDPRTWETLAADAKGACLVIGPQAAFSRNLIETLRGQGPIEDLTLVLQPEDRRRIGPGQSDRAGRVDRAVPTKRDRLARLAAIGLGGERGAQEGFTGRLAAELMVLPAGLFSKGQPLADSLLAQSGEEQRAEGDPLLSRLVELAAAERRIRIVEAAPDANLWARDVHDAGDASAVERDLYRSLKGHFEGIVDRYFNRKLSPFFTKLFLKLKLSPNAITVAATLIGLAGAACFGMGTYAAGLLGALLFQLAAVIDCCDGEVARLTFTESPLGAKLDLVLDNVVHMAVFAGIAYGAYQAHAASEQAWLYLALGAVAVIFNALACWLVTRLAAHPGAPAGASTARWKWTDFLLKNIATRDFSMVVLLFAAIGRLDWFLLLAVIGSTLFGLVLIWLVFSARSPRVA
ncbi:1L-myo-inositol-1-phosphate cytidylyltransferase [Nitrospira tepida]|uniref:1L-myo-inositol-1-phosphate cytidylyltransferase n=1 Tax=Nitrospira tepida TaxID=2973512 RepID=A0AA86MX93_9BACT|nr:CDP-alcohol phosphatidyltransferase family protein [Nitrospira tepida]CAI4030580.1 1L-myo-inositol-1-phosphate cytidylyltransferase [Nitrospira tepida]